MTTGFTQSDGSYTCGGGSDHVRVASSSPSPCNQPPVFVRAVPTKCEDPSVEGLNPETVSRFLHSKILGDGLTSDVSLELVYPPDDGR